MANTLESLLCVHAHSVLPSRRPAKRLSQAAGSIGRQASRRAKTCLAPCMRVWLLSYTKDNGKAAKMLCL